MADNNSDIIRKLDPTSSSDVAVGTNRTTTWTQKLTSKEIDRNDIFSVK